MKKKFKRLGNAIIYYSLVVVLFISIIATCIVSKIPTSLLILIGFICGFIIGRYITKIIKIIKLIKIENETHKLTMKLMLMLGYSKKEIKKQKKIFNKKKVYIIK